MPHQTNKNRRPTNAAAAASHYGQQQWWRHRLQHVVNAAVSPRDVLDPARLRRRFDFWPRNGGAWTVDRNNNNNNQNEGISGQKRSYVGAVIYKTDEGWGGSAGGQLAIHVFDGYRVKISRRLESESKAVERICNEKSLSHSSSNVYVVQKFVPVHYSSKSHFELDADGAFEQRHQVTLNFQRKFVTKLEWSVGPGLDRQTKRYHSEAYLNVF